MRSIIIAALLVAGPACADFVYQDDNGLRVRLTNAACEVPHAAEVLHSRFGGIPRHAMVNIRGKIFRACWVLDPDGDYAIMDSDGGGGILFARFFKETPNA